MSEDNETKAYGDSESNPPETLDQHFADIAKERKAFQAGIEFATAQRSIHFDTWLGVNPTGMDPNDAFEHYRAHSGDSL